MRVGRSSTAAAPTGMPGVNPRSGCEEGDEAHLEEELSQEKERAELLTETLAQKNSPHVDRIGDLVPELDWGPWDPHRNSNESEVSARKAICTSIPQDDEYRQPTCEH